MAFNQEVVRVLRDAARSLRSLRPGDYHLLYDFLRTTMGKSSQSTRSTSVSSDGATRSRIRTPTSRRSTSRLACTHTASTV